MCAWTKNTGSTEHLSLTLQLNQSVVHFCDSMEISPLPVMLLLVSFLRAGSDQERPQTVLSVFPHSWLTQGVSVSLSCEVTDSSTGWTFSWYKAVPYRKGLTPVLDINDYVRYYVELLSDSSRGAGGSYTLSPAALHHTGVYVCRAERGEPAYQTQYSNLQPLWITGVSPPASLIISPNRTQHFIYSSLSLSCEGQSDSTGWTVTHTNTQHGWVSNCSSHWGSGTGSKCTFKSLYIAHTGLYWCQSESGGSSNPVNITVHDGDVILESPVHPVTEGDPLTLHCLLRSTIPSILRALFYKDGLVLQNQPAGEMTIRTVSQSDEGLYHCKHPERGESPSSWVSVRALPTATLNVESQSPVFTGESVTLKCEIEPFSNWRYQWYKGSSQTAVNQSEINTFTIRSPADQDQYWCRGERLSRPTSSQDSNKVRLSVKAKPTPELTSSLKGAALEGNSVTLHCKVEQSARWRFYWSKHTQNPENETNTANSSYTISSMAPSDGGQYWCRAGRGNPVYYTHYSDALWVNVTVTMNSAGDTHLHVLVVLAVGLSLVLLFILLVLLWCYKTKKGVCFSVGNQSDTSQTSDQTQRKSGDEAADEPSDVTYAQVMKHNKSRNKDRTVPVQDSQIIYSQIQSGGGTDAGAGPSEVTYAEVEMKLKKKTKSAEKTSVGTDTVYSELRQDTHKGC